VLYLAFANSTANPLPKLGEEHNRLSAILAAAEQEGLCEVVTSPYATVEEILGVLGDPRYRRRIALFHYAGHANAYQLLVQGSGGQEAAAHAGGLAAFLAHQPELALVFLNACSTQPQVQGLIDAGVHTAVATSQAIADEVAVEFAARFYTALAAGVTVESAYGQAAAAVRTQRGDNLRKFYHIDGDESAPAPPLFERLPWELARRPGSTIAATWTLPAAARNHLFGLPKVPPGRLPPNPFRNLVWYTRAEAEVFFGRDRDIRTLYQAVTMPGHTPIVLYCGQSGVGKSSLLAAGLQPRLEQVQQVVYARRRAELGLLGTLCAELQCEPGDLAAAWRSREVKCPLTVILDQVEEVYTRRYPGAGDEVREFLQALHPLLDAAGQQPQGGLVLSFRKEWLADIQKRVEEAGFAYLVEYLARLDGEGIVQVITGPTQSERLAAHYKLRIAGPELPNRIAEDLEGDRGSAIAPTLQIVLAKMWERARRGEDGWRLFDDDLYDQVRAEGLGLEPFLNNQLADLETNQPEAVRSGLALDLLHYHTTELGTAAARTLSDLEQRYAHQAAKLPALVQGCLDRYLLVDPRQEQEEGAPRPTRLAHDTLAPVVRKHFAESDRPGQWARRILESRVVPADGAATPKAPPLLADDQLAVVEAGKGGMRSHTPDEENLVQASRQASDARKRTWRIVQGLGLLAVTLIAVAAIVAFVQWGEARRQTGLKEEEAAKAVAAAATAEVRRVEAEDARAEADEQRNVAVAAQDEAETQRNSALAAQAEAETQRNEAIAQAQLGRRAQARNLAAEVLSELAQPQPDYDLALLLAQEAISVTWKPDGYALADAIAATTEALRPVLAWRMNLPRRRHDDPIDTASFSPDGRRILTRSMDGTAKVWDAQSGEERLTLTARDNPVYQAILSPDGEQILTASADGTTKVWDAQSGRELRTLSLQGVSLRFARFSPDGNRIVTVDQNGIVKVSDARSGEEIITFSGHGDQVFSAVFSPDGQQIVTASVDQTAKLWDVQSGEEVRTLSGHENYVYSAHFAPDGKRIVTASEDGTAKVWDAQSGEELLTLMGHEGPVYDATFSADGQRIATASGDSTAKVWDAQSGEEVLALNGHEAIIASVNFSPDGQQIVTASADETAKVWDAQSGEEVLTLDGHTDVVNYAAFSPDGKLLVTAGGDRTVRVWDAQNGRELSAASGHKDIVGFAAFSPDGKRIVTSSIDGIAKVWDVHPGNELLSLQSSGDWLNSALYSPDGTLLVMAGGDGVATVWNVESGQEVLTLAGHEERSSIYRAAFRGDGSLIVTAGGDRTARVWNAQTGEQLLSLSGHTDNVNSAEFSPDGRLIVTASWDETAKVWDAQNGEEVRTLRGHQGSVISADFSPDGKRIVTASGDGTAKVWDAQSGEEVLTFNGHTVGLGSALFSADGQRILTAGWDGIAKVWDAQSGEEILTLVGHGGAINSAVFSADEQRIVTAGVDGMAHVWDAQSGKELLTIDGQQGDIYWAQFSLDGQQIVTVGGDSSIARIWPSTVEAWLELAASRVQRYNPWLTLEERGRFELE
jgi:WD40 repeat protein